MTRAVRSGVALAVAGAALFVVRAAPAAGRTTDAINMSSVKIRIDGLLKEWPGKMTELADTLTGSPGGDRAAASVGYDDRNVYVALKLTDRKIARTPAAGAAEDHATLIVALPSGRGYATHAIEIYPGDPGHVAGVVKQRGGGAVGGAKVVEAPAKGGLEVEAQIPWSAFPGGARVRVGLRGAVQYTDASAPGSVQAVMGTSTAQSGGALPPLRLDAEQAMDVNLIAPNNLPAAPSRVAYGDVDGDSMTEQVAVHGKYLTIAGPHYRGGDQFYFGELGVTSPTMVDSLQLRDVDGDGKQEIIVQKRIGGSDRYRGMIEVLKVGTNDTPYRLFAHETAIVTPDGRVVNKVRLVPKGRGVAIEIAQDQAEGFEPDTYKEPVSDDMPSALLPWESVTRRTFAWDGKAFTKSDEKTGTPKLTKHGAHHAARKPEGPPPPPPPRPPTSDELLDRVYALYRKERHVGASSPRFDFVTDVVGDTRPERVLIHQKDIVVFGKGFRDGTSYAFITIGVAEPKDILDVTARDLTGDGKAEVIVRAVLHAKASKELGGDTVDRYALFVYKVTDQGIGRIFAAETGRALGQNRVLGTVAFLPAQRGLTIELRPGRAIGWTEQSYPFPADTTTAGGLEPLLLPWGQSAARRYAFDGSGYAMK